MFAKIFCGFIPFKAIEKYCIKLKHKATQKMREAETFNWEIEN